VPFTLPALALALVLGASLPLATGVPLPASLAAAAASALLVVATVGGSGVRRLAVVAACVPAAAGMASVPPPAPGDGVANDASVLYVGRVVEGPRPARDGAPFVLRVVEVRSEGAVIRADAIVRVRNGFGGFTPTAGDVIAVRGRLVPPRPARHPWAWDAERADARAGRSGQLFADGPLLHAGTSHALTRRLDRARMRTEARVLETLDGPERGVVLAILTGSRGDLDSGLRERFAATGAAHVLAVSGLHLGLVVLGVRGALVAVARRIARLTRRFGARRVAAALTLPAVVAYVVFTGAPASACRAGWMTGALLVAEVAERRARGRHALALAVAALVVWDPTQVADAGFQLSVTATAGLVEMRRLGWAGVGGRLCEGLYASTVASFATAPVLAWHFGVVPLASPLTNLVVVPPIAFVALPLAAVGAVAGPIAPGVADLAIAGAGLAVRVGAGLLELGGAGLAASWTPGRLPIPGLVALSVLAGVAARVRGRGALALGFACCGVAAASAPGPLHDHLVVHTIPVGHGDAIALQGPDGGRWLIDGGTAAAAHRFVVPWLEAHGRPRLDGVVVTHGDRDHAEGAAVLVRYGRPVDVWLPAAGRGGAIRAVREASDAVGARVHALRGGVCVALAGAPAQLVAGTTDDNDGGVVVRVCHGVVCGLFTGDVEAPREAAMVRDGVGRVVWLKVAHHGSRTSSTPAWLDATRPAVGLVTVDRGGRAGAHPAVLARLRRRGVHLHVTGDGPPPALVTDGARWWTCPIRPLPRGCPPTRLLSVRAAQVTIRGVIRTIASPSG